jgi:hypothetical protein
LPCPATSLRFTTRYGDEDVWSYLHNLDLPHDCAYVRDHKAGLLYFGRIELYSESGDDRELVLESVTVYDNDTAKELYTRDVLYVSRDAFDLIIEIPHVEVDEELLSVEVGKGDG